MNKEKKKFLVLENSIDIQPLISTRDFLKEALAKAQNKFEIAGAIQAFEVSYELAWKTLRKVLRIGSRDVFRLAAQRINCQSQIMIWLPK